MGILDGKVAIVTGSGQGIGRGIAVGLARQGAKVITNNRKPGSVSIRNYDRSAMPEEDWKEMLSLAGDAEGTAELIRSEGGEASYFYGDVADWDTARALVQYALDTYGRIDILVNNAAGLGSGSIVDLDAQKWEYLTRGKMQGAFNMMHFAVPHMIEQKFGRILNCASGAWTGLPDNDAYSAANAAIVGLTWASAQELYHHGITVNAYCPEGKSPGHAVEFRKMVRHAKAVTGVDPDPKVLAVVEANHGDPVNLGPIMAYLCSDKAGFISGEVFDTKSSGTVGRFSFPTLTQTVRREPGTGYLWPMEDMEEVFRRLLGEDYVSPASKKAFA